MRLASCLLALACLCNFSARAQSSATVSVVEPSRSAAISTGATTDIFIDGALDSKTVDQFKAVLAQRHLTKGTVHLNSKGGSVLAGLELGTLIRNNGLSTNVGQRNSWGGLPRPGECSSACPYAFLGGVYRYASKESQIGVHRFFVTGGVEPNLDMVEVVSAAIANHILNMGADLGLLELMTLEGGDNIRMLSPEELRDLNVVDNGIREATWGLFMVNGFVYLKGQQVTAKGTGKMTFHCHDRNLIGFAFYGGQDMAAVAATTKYSVRIDDKLYPMQDPMTHAKVDERFVDIHFPLSQEQFSMMAAANDIGFAFHKPRGSSYYGFLVHVGDEGRTMLLDFAKYCDSHEK